MPLNGLKRENDKWKKREKSSEDAIVCTCLFGACAFRSRFGQHKIVIVAYILYWWDSGKHFSTSHGNIEFLFTSDNLTVVVKFSEIFLKYGRQVAQTAIRRESRFFIAVYH